MSTATSLQTGPGTEGQVGEGWLSGIVTSLTSGSKPPGFKFQLCHLLAV